MPPRPPLASAPFEQASKRTEDVDFGELVQRTAEDAVHLVEQEGLLLKRELELRLEHGRGMVAIGSVGTIGTLLTLLSATATAILVLSLVLPAWVAALIVAAAWGTFSAIGLIAFAMVRLDAQTTLKPEITERFVRRDVYALMAATGGE